MLTVSNKIKFTIIVEDFPVEVYGGVAEHNSLLDYSVQVWEIWENQLEAIGSGYFKGRTVFHRCREEDRAKQHARTRWSSLFDKAERGVACVARNTRTS